MDSQDYLNQIAAASRPMKPPKKGFAGILSSKYFKWGMVALIALVLIMLVGSMLGSKPSLKDECISLKLRLDSDVELMNEYQGDVKSLSLRSLSSSLRGVFSNLSSQLGTYMTNTYQFDESKDVKEAVVEEAELNKTNLNDELFKAKINGLLDRVYAHKMALEIYTVMSQEKGIFDKTDDAAFKEILSPSYTSLNNLYTQFNDFSETNNK
ncbi:hypothetical protein IJ076_00255 [Candidatus Saccharibacteria bacterium]|nr:hypothetical protein [Candidatus Saccharibacteria bacterium]